MMPKIP